MTKSNMDRHTVVGFGDEWNRFDQSDLSAEDHLRIFDNYFSVFPTEALSETATGADFGSGSGRWAKVIAPKVGQLICVDASGDALAVARRNLAKFDNCRFMESTIEDAPIPNASLDFAYSLGVLHHIPDTGSALVACVDKLKSGAPFLLYLYYRLDDRPLWFRAIWRASDVVRKVVCRLPLRLRHLICDMVATTVYWPFARIALLTEKAGLRADGLPLSYYRDKQFYVMRTDALDRLGTRLEKRFSRTKMQALMERAGLESIRFSDRSPFWCAVGFRRTDQASDPPASASEL